MSTENTRAKSLEEMTALGFNPKQAALGVDMAALVVLGFTQEQIDIVVAAADFCGAEVAIYVRVAVLGGV